MLQHPQAFFLPVDDDRHGQRFCLFHPAQGETIRGHVLYIHPFAEEMNKSRRMAALQARAFARGGYAVLQLDLLGCGDSSGGFGDASWRDWVNDVVLGCNWLLNRDWKRESNLVKVPLWLWGLRAGCLLAVEASRELDEACNFLLWQPPPAGKPLLQQFMRLKVAGNMLGGQSKAGVSSMREQLANGSPVEIAGYLLSPALASGFDQATLAPSAGTSRSKRMEWFELSSREDASLSPISVQMIAQWQQAGVETRSRIVRGSAFWQTNEIEEVPELIAATMAAMSA